MPLPDYSPRSDSFGNWYFGGFQVDSQVEIGYGAGTGLTATQSDWNAFLNSAFGSLNWASTSTLYAFRFVNSYEQLTGQVTTTSGFRFAFPVSGFPETYKINTAPTGSPVVTATFSGVSLNSFLDSGACQYAVANQYGMWMVRAAKGTTGTLFTNLTSGYYGWVKNPVFPINTTDRVRNLIMGPGFSAGDNGFSAPVASNSTSRTNCITNSVITCSASIPGANITDLCVLDPLNSYLNIGSLYNACFYPGTGLTIGHLYRIPPASDPDGNTEQNIWLCADTVRGWNGSVSSDNAGYRLIRVWSNNIT